jgi:hypothetical protein
MAHWGLLVFYGPAAREALALSTKPGTAWAADRRNPIALFFYS